MSRPYSPSENAKKARGRRQFALNRVELRRASEPRTPASGSTSAPLKARNDHDDSLIQDFLSKQKEPAP
jgi:hypothetical protein